MAGLVVSPGRGLFLFCLVLAFGCAEWWSRGRERSLNRFLLGGLVLTIVGVARTTWWGGFTYGPRYFADVVPVLVFAMATAVDRLNVPWKVAFGVLGVCGVWIQIVGAFGFLRGASMALEEF